MDGRRMRLKGTGRRTAKCRVNAVRGIGVTGRRVHRLRVEGVVCAPCVRSSSFPVVHKAC